jgi:hypothetical protein
MPRLDYEGEQQLMRDIKIMREQGNDSERLRQQEKINAATTAIVAALGPLDTEARQRVLKAANILLGMEHPNG